MASMSGDERPALRARLGLFETTVAGIGVILGAGVYALIGEAAGSAGSALWLSFALGAVAAALVGLGYAELSSMYPRAGADYEYTRNAFGLQPAFIVGWLVVISNLVGAATVALAFGQYLDDLLGVPVRLAAMAALAVSTLIVLAGIKEAVWFSIVLTAIEAAGLVVVIAIGIPHVGEVDPLALESGLGGIFGGTALVMFAYLGFEQIATLAEETAEGARVIPKATLIAIAATGVLYVLVALAAVSALGVDALAASEAPLADVARTVWSRAGSALAVVALFSTANTMLLMLVAASRLVYGMADTEALPRFLAWVHPRVHTPARAIGLGLLVSLGFAASGDLGLVAGAANFAAFVGFAAVHASLIRLRLRYPDLPRPFAIRGAVRGVPVLSVVALAVIGVLLFSLEWDALAIGAALLLAGVLVAGLLRLWHPLPQAAPRD